MAGIIAGHDPSSLLSSGEFQGIAPGARLTSLKVATTEGAVDVSQVVAAVDWVVAHRNDDPANPIRVLNLSYGTDGVQDYRIDPLTHAVENAWRAGIVVVVAGGNSGTDQPRLNNPAYDPYVLAVGAADTQGTVGASDDVVPAFSSRGDAARRVDLVAPGRSIKSLRDPGSYVDEAHPDARVGRPVLQGQRLLAGGSRGVGRGGAAAAEPSRPASRPGQGAAARLGRGDARGRRCRPRRRRARRLPGLPRIDAGHHARPGPPSTGLGSLESARGTQHVADDGVELTGEKHVLGTFKRQEVGAGQRSLHRLVGRLVGRQRVDRHLLVRDVAGPGSPGPGSPGPGTRGPASRGPRPPGPGSPGPGSPGPASRGPVTAGPATAGPGSPGPGSPGRPLAGTNRDPWSRD